ncbi:hypothetical protein CsSME_00040783 [Camellia sinensis var. sinensis]
MIKLSDLYHVLIANGSRRRLAFIAFCNRLSPPPLASSCSFLAASHSSPSVCCPSPLRSSSLCHSVRLARAQKRK